jgi:PAS domain S-box-containing protein
MDEVFQAERLHGDEPAASSPQGRVDRRELAFIAVERTRMPMVVCDPRQSDNPIVLANQAFIDLTGYSADELIGRNCRFLQGPDTDPRAIDAIRGAIAEEREITVEMLNYRRDGSRFWNQFFLSPVHDDDGTLLYFFGSQLDVSHRRTANDLEAAEHLLLREVDHRAKNALALVQSIVRLSRDDDPRAYAEAVQGRVDALARAHAILSDKRWRSVPLDELLATEVEPFGYHRIARAGPAVALASNQVQPLALVLHEMLANAARHGALSAAQGTVDIQWDRTADGRLRIDWNERGGPPPAEPRIPGFGSTIIEAIVARQLRGEASYAWQPAGLMSTLTIPIED